LHFFHFWYFWWNIIQNW